MLSLGHLWFALFPTNDKTMLPDRSHMISIVLVVGHRRQRAGRALQSVLEQANGLECEILIADLTDGDHPPLPNQDQPRVRVLQVRWGRHLGEMRQIAIAEARDEVVAFLEDHVTIDPGYLLAVSEAFKDEWAAVGPVVRNANPDVGVSSTVHLLHYGLWNPSSTSGEVGLLPGNNSAYQTAVLKQYGDRLECLLLTDTVFQMRLRADGHRLCSEPSARLNHLNATSLKTAMTSEYLFHRCFVVARRLEFGWSGLERLWAIARTPITPWVRLLRLARLVIVQMPSRRRRFFLDLPSLVTLQHAAAWGQLAGLLLGFGDAPHQFTVFELDYSRPTAFDH